jgi:hypothetical protein
MECDELARLRKENRQLKLERDIQRWYTFNRQSGHRPLVHFQLAIGGTFWVAAEGCDPLAARRHRAKPWSGTGGVRIPETVHISRPSPEAEATSQIAIGA